MTHCKSITIIVLSLCTITPNSCEQISVDSETLRYGAPNCIINDLRNTLDSDGEHFHFSLTIDRCSLPSIPSAAFADSRFIDSLFISDSNVNSIDANAFDGFRVLERVSLTGNNFTKFHRWSGEDLNTMKELDLERNGIREVGVTALRPYRNLEYLSLANNLIAELPNGFFGKMSSIRILHLDGNGILRIGEETFKPLLHLEHLHLENNEISFIDEHAFTTLAHLKTLRLDSNQITALGTALLFATPRLQILNLSNNALDSLAMEFHENIELKVIDLSYNSLTALQSDTVGGVLSVEVFNISHNRLRTIEPSALRDFVHVKHLDISNNELPSLRDNQLAYLESIEHLNLSYNSIDSIQPFTFTDLRTLRSIDLSHNRLESDEFVQKIVELRSLDLSANRYRSINMTAFEGVGEVKLIGNLWSCSWLVNELVNSTANVRDDVHFGNELAGIDAKAMGIRQPEEVICFDDRDAGYELNNLIQRHIVIVYPKSECSRSVLKKTLAIDGPSRPFSELLSNEFDFKACLIWTIIAVIVVIGLVRLIKCCLDKSEQRSERYRITQQEKVMKDIEDYFSRANTEKEDLSENVCV